MTRERFSRSVKDRFFASFHIDLDERRRKIVLFDQLIDGCGGNPFDVRHFTRYRRVNKSADGRILFTSRDDVDRSVALAFSEQAFEQDHALSHSVDCKVGLQASKGGTSGFGSKNAPGVEPAGRENSIKTDVRANVDDIAVRIDERRSQPRNGFLEKASIENRSENVRTWPDHELTLVIRRGDPDVRFYQIVDPRDYIRTGRRQNRRKANQLSADSSWQSECTSQPKSALNKVDRVC